MPDSDQSAHRQQRSRGLSRLGPLLLAILLTGCAGHVIQSDDVQSGTALDTGTVHDRPARPPNPPATAQAPPADDEQDTEIWQRLRAGFRLGDIRHPRIEHEIRLLQRSPNAFHALMARSEPYLHHILNEFEKAGLPTELALLPAVESGFKPYVYSPDGAAGLWQFMPATGRMLGLEQDWWFDKRRSVRASTRAAIAYLSRLNQRFDGDWLYTLAAYNAGAGTVSRALRIAGRNDEPRDFWSLDLPGETDRYIPRLLAVASIVADPDAYGLELPEIVDRPFFAPVKTASQIDLTVAANLAGIPVEELLALNAGHKRWTSRPDGPHELLLPVERVDDFRRALAELPEDQRLRWRHHRIRPGDSLNRIAREFGVSVDAIRQVNRLADSRIRAGEELVIPLSDAVTFADAGTNGTARQRMHYRVRKGDSLYAIARRFQVTIGDLKRWNRVGRYLRPGERLTLFIDPDA